MEKYPILKFPKEYWPEYLHQIPNPPKTLYYRGSLPPPDYKYLCVIGPRKYTEYGETVCRELIAGLAGFPIVIVSGLAYGIDSIAHQTALENKMCTIAFPGSGLHESVIYPRVHFNLAKQILENGGTLISEFPADTVGAPWTFPARNKLMAGISHATLVIEAGDKSGTMITSRLALDFNRDVLAVPGSIFSPASFGTHKLIRDGAVPVTCAADILEALGFDITDNILEQAVALKTLETKLESLSSAEKEIYHILEKALSIDEIALQIEMEISLLIQTLSELEMKNLITEESGVFRRKN